jgi:hypothetical protein
VQIYVNFHSCKIFKANFSTIFVFLQDMKTLLTVLSALFVGVTPAWTQTAIRTSNPADTPQNTQPSTPLRFDVTEWSFGDIPEEGGSVSHLFTFTNTAPTPIAIDRVAASCGCTTPDYPRTPVAPGAKASIRVTFDPLGMPGEFTKTITIISGGGKYRDYLAITGNVTPRPRTVEEDFPHDMGSGLRLSTTLLAHRSVARGNASSMVVHWVNTSDKAVTLAFTPVEGSGLVDIHAPETLCTGCRGDITFTYDMSSRTVYGPIHDVVRPVVDGVPSTRTIYNSATGIDSFEGVDLASAPKLFLDALFHDFGEVRRRAVPYTFRLVASNEGSGMLHIRSVTPARGLQTTLREGMTIAPGATLPFEVMFYGNRHEQGEVQATIGIVVDDPMRPVREIRIAAIVRN